MQLPPFANFDSFLATVQMLSPESRQSVVEAYLQNHALPRVEGGSLVHFGYRSPTASQILLEGDFNNFSPTDPLTQLENTNLWYVSRPIQPGGRYEYRFRVDGEKLLDPFNGLVESSPLFGPRSVLLMPGYEESFDQLPRPDVPKGRRETFSMVSSAMGRKYFATVYLPPGYDSSQLYPVMYFQDGLGYVNFGKAFTIFDNLIAENMIPPLIGVFVPPAFDRNLEYDFNPDYVRFLADELTPELARRYSISDERAIGGASYGGLMALYAALEQPDFFKRVLVQSGYFSRQNGRILTILNSSPALPSKTSLSIGSYETAIQNLPDGDFLAANRTLRNLLGPTRCDYIEFAGGHSWGCWRDMLGRQLRYLWG